MAGFLMLIGLVGAILSPLALLFVSVRVFSIILSSCALIMSIGNLLLQRAIAPTTQPEEEK